jgi:hypothetical protein
MFAGFLGLFLDRIYRISGIFFVFLFCLMEGRNFNPAELLLIFIPSKRDDGFCLSSGKAKNILFIL